MKGFLEHIVNEIQEDDLLQLKDNCYVFPTRRACVHFHELLATRFREKVFISPAVLSIEEFIQELTPGLVVADELTLLFKLFKIYRQEDPSTKFENFYVWGQTLLKDFDEIDRYLVDGEVVYQNLKEIQDVDAAFGPEEEAKKAFLEFQNVIDVSGKAKLYKAFLENWLTVGKVLPKFKQAIMAEGLAYMGLCYRHVAEKLGSNELVVPYHQVIFAGFNALSTTEERIFEQLLQREQALVYFDADQYYLNNEAEEAGRFLRRYKKIWRNKNVQWVITNGFEEPKEIHITGTSQQVAQARQAAHEVIEQRPAGYGGSTNSAIVMADESLLFPVLYAIPEHQDLNITMGYPLISSGIGSLILAYLRYQAAIAENTRTSENPLLDQESFQQLIAQPSLQPYGIIPLSKAGLSKSRWIGWQFIQKELEQLEMAQVVERILQPATDVSFAINTITAVILQLLQNRKETEQQSVILEERITVAAVQYLDSLKGLLHPDNLPINLNTLERVVRETLKQQKVPFAGEPLMGLQIMGFLETRTLDFENLVLLSVNEGLLPSSSTSKTYLPFGLRKSFGLPTFIEHNSIYAYHFFRLLQRSKRITLLYNAELAFDGSGEKSRFILQLTQRLKGKDNIKLVENTLVTPIKDNTGEKVLIQVDKKGEALKKLNLHKEQLEDKMLSPTAILNYVECSLKYYFSRILKIRPVEEDSFEIDARDFGNLLHQVMEEVYSPYLDKVLTPEDIGRILKQELMPVVERCFTDYLQFHAKSSEITFVEHVISYLASKILENDKSEAPLKIVDLESEHYPLSHSLKLDDGSSILLGGKIDRLDAVQLNDKWLYRVLDYKTGKFELGRTTYNRKALLDEEYINRYYQNPDLKSGFQTYFYALLFNKKYPEEHITGGIYGVKSVKQGVSYLRNLKEPLNTNVIIEFEERLKQLLTELFNPEVPFEQTEDEKRCLYCDFKGICNR